MADYESDIEIRTTLPKNITKKIPSSPKEGITDDKNKKLTTKMMIRDALKDLHTRKGVSYYAIKKYLTEKYDVDTDKIKFIIKKNIMSGVADGSLIQMKGVGVSGSFKLAPTKEKKLGKVTKKPKEEKLEKSPKKVKKEPEKKKPEKKKSEKEKPEKPDSKAVKKKKKEKTGVKIKEKKVKEAKQKEVKEKKLKKQPTIEAKTPTKKKTSMMKRKSIGSIIKRPKMKPSSVK